MQLRTRDDIVGYREGLWFGETGPAGKQQPGPRMGREERAKTLSPFKAAGTQAPSPTPAAGQGRGPRMLLGPQKECSLREC